MTNDISVNAVAFFGFIFNPGHAGFTIPPRSNFKPTKGEKKLLNGKLFKNDTDKAKDLVTQILTKFFFESPFPELTTPFFTLGSREDEGIQQATFDFTLACMKSARQPDQMVRCFNHLSGANEAAQQHRIETIPRDIVHQWVGKLLNQLHDQSTKLIQTEGIELSFEENVQRDIDFIGAHVTATYWNNAIKETGLDEKLEQLKHNAFALALHNTPPAQELAFKCIWLYSYVGISPIPLIYLAAKYSCVPEPERFPFINRALIDYFVEWLNRKDNDYYTNLETFRDGVSMWARTEQVYKSYKEQSDIWPCLFAIRDILEPVSSEQIRTVRLKGFFDNVGHKLAKLVKKIEPLKHRDERLTLKEQRLAEMYHDIYSIGVENSDNQLFAELFAHTEHLEIISPAIKDSEDAVDAWHSEQSTLDTINAKARDISSSGADLLDAAFEELTLLRERKREATEKLERANQALIDNLNGLFDLLTRMLDEMKGLTNDSEVSSEDAQEKLIKGLKANNYDLNRQVTELRDKLSQSIERQLSKNVKTDDATRGADLSLKDTLELCEKELSLSGVLRLITIKYPDNVSVAPRVWKSLRDNKHFSRKGLLYEKLRTLCSPEFLEGYQKGGSENAHNYFTKDEIAFGESEATIANKPTSRTFTFDDGITKDCQMHLRIGVDGKKQHTLRVYFVLADNHVYIGEIVTHLPTISER